MARPSALNDRQENAVLRRGGASAGLFGGFVLGLVLGGICVLAGADSIPGWLVFASAIGGAVFGYVSVSSGFSLLGGALSFLVGMMSGVVLRLPPDKSWGSGWLFAILALGVIAGACVLLLLR